MSRRTWNMDFGPLRGFYRCFVLFTWLTVLAYVAATLLIREKPLVYSGRETEYAFWRRTHDDRWSRL